MSYDPSTNNAQTCPILRTKYVVPSIFYSQSLVVFTELQLKNHPANLMHDHMLLLAASWASLWLDCFVVPAHQQHGAQPYFS
jgi:hypothetical protein